MVFMLSGLHGSWACLSGVLFVVFTSGPMFNFEVASMPCLQAHTTLSETLLWSFDYVMSVLKMEEHQGILSVFVMKHAEIE